MKKAIFSEQHRILVGRLRQARLAAGLDQRDVARLLGTSQSYISKIESGQRRVDVFQLKEFAKIYKKSIGYFLR
ncbi:MAG: helix-turn-helix transcriptional regulator [Anaerolineae bacterium]|nr:helix-turn-helix transcriptional regulator [Anaerolineae bacterium]